MRSLPRLPPRPPDAHKGDFCRALLIGGSRGMAGAISLAGMSCLRSGAGLVKLAVPDCILDLVAGFEPAYMTVPLACDSAGRLAAAPQEQLQPSIDAATCIACGPGLSQSPDLTSLVRGLYLSVTQPMVIDADGLNALAAIDDGLSQPAGPRIFTPHPGEFARLAKTPPDDKPTRQEQIARAKELASQHKLVILLKGHHTIVTDGSRLAENTTGNPGMATGGTGDVLTGLIAALIGQALTPFDAACMGAFVHGLAGDLARDETGEVSLIATDILDHLPEAIQSYQGETGDESF